jgi:hypothetical protein
MSRIAYKGKCLNWSGEVVEIGFREAREREHVVLALKDEEGHGEMSALAPGVESDRVWSSCSREKFMPVR